MNNRERQISRFKNYCEDKERKIFLKVLREMHIPLCKKLKEATVEGIPISIYFRTHDCFGNEIKGGE